MNNRPSIAARILILTLAVSAVRVARATQDNWPPAPQLDAATAVDGAAPLPPSIAAKPHQQTQWRCTFRFRPPSEAKQVALVGSFNNWDRESNPMRGPDPAGDWTGEIILDTGVYQYKFLVNNEEWHSDPANLDRVPDGYGHFNSFVRLGRLAQMQGSPAKVGDGQIDALGLAHRCPLPLYVQPVSSDAISIRYRTLAHDVRGVSLAVKEAASTPMAVITEGPLFAYWETQVPLPAADARSPDVHGLTYTFVLDDGAGVVCDPYTYHYTHTPSSMLKAPDWAKDAVWYQIVLDRFRNGDATNDPDPVRPWTSEWFTPSPWEGRDGQTFYQNFVYDRFYGGDLAGLEEKLPYLKELGVNALYLTPIFKAPSYHKYDVQDFRHIDDGFGTRGDYDEVTAREDLLDPHTWQWTETDRRFLAFLQKAHAMGFKVILDAVFNHVGVDHPAFKDVLKNGKRSRYANWFEVTSWEPFAYKGWAGFAHMPVFRKNRNGFASPEVKQHLFAVTRRWMDPNGDGDPSDGVDGWRLDVPNNIAHRFWSEWRHLVKETNPDALITGEIWNRADEWLDGRSFDAVMNYEFARTAVQWLFDRARKIPASAAAARFAELRLAYPVAATYCVQNLVNSHDTDRLASMVLNPDREYDRQNRVQEGNPDYDNRKPSPDAYARARLAVLLQMTYVGTPMIYYGDEVGMWGADDPSNRKPMLWSDLAPFEQPRENVVMDEQLNFYKQAIALRNAHPSLRAGSMETLLTDDAADVWAFVRADDHEQVLVILNASNAPRSVHVPLSDDLATEWKTVFGEADDLAARAGALSVTVPPITGIVLLAN
jgi:cyclomaltodextrinase